MTELSVQFGTDSKPLAYFSLDEISTRSAVNQIPSAQISLRSDRSDLTGLEADAQLCAPGVEVKITHQETGTILFIGVVVQLEVEQPNDDGPLRLKLKAKHALQRLVANRRSRLFLTQSDGEIVPGILREWGIACDSPEGLEDKHPQMVQLLMTDWQFVRSRLQANGMWLVPTSASVKFMRPKLAGTPDHAIARAGSNSKTVKPSGGRWCFNNEELAHALQVSAWDIEQQQMSNLVSSGALNLGSDAFDPSKLINLTEKYSAEPWKYAYGSALSVDEQRALATAQMLQQSARSVYAGWNMAGIDCLKYQLGDTLEVSGFGKRLSGRGVITELQHQYDRHGWSATVRIGQDPSTFSEVRPLPRVPSLFVGIVEKYQEDPDRLDRLLVRLPLLEQPLWARFASPYASKEAGLCLYPEPGDEVVLGFFGEDPRFPVILGAMHNPKNKAPYAPSDKNREKAFVFARGKTRLSLAFDVEDASVVLDTGKETVTLKGGIGIKASDDLTVDVKKTAAIAAGKKLDLTGKNGVEIKGSKIDLKR